MYLSRIALNTKRKETMRAIMLPRLLHGAVEQSFNEKSRRNLWRIDWLCDTCYLLLLSAEQPDYTHIAEQFGYPLSEKRGETKDYSLLLTRLKEGESWMFRLRANPTRSSFKEKHEGSGRGKVFAHVTQEQQKQWLLMRAGGCGFMLNEDAFDVVHSKWEKFPKKTEGNREVTLRIATFEGVLIISDLERFKQTLLSGIGRGKAYGCGLLTIANCGANGDE